MVASKHINVDDATPELVKLVNHAAAAQEIITLTADGGKSAVLLSLEAFEYLVGLQKYRRNELMP